MLFNGNSQEYLRLEEIDDSNCYFLKETIESALTLVWFTEDGSELVIDNQLHTFKKDQLLFLTEFHKVTVTSVKAARMVRFNRSFYCILDHDASVGCKGVLFFGASQLPLLNIPEDQIEKFNNLWHVFQNEMESHDELQMDMLQMMLKRLVILSTRLYKEQNNYSLFETGNLDLVREFNFLVEKHYKSKHTVSEYADLLNKSPKTISNLFSKLGSKTPLGYIQDRIMLEARRLLSLTDMNVKEVAYETGFEDIHSFSRFFKKNEGVSPKEFKETARLGKIANS